MSRHLACTIGAVLGTLAAFSNLQAQGTMPPHGPYARDCRPDNVRAALRGGVTMAFDCFASDGDGAMYGARIRFTPNEERYSTGGATSSALQIFVSADASCPEPHDGSTIALSSPCILIEEAAALPDGGLAIASTCAFKSTSPMLKLFPPQCSMGLKADDTSGSVTFTRWSTARGGSFAFTFSPNARLTEFVANVKAPHGESETAVPISGSATVTLE